MTIGSCWSKINVNTLFCRCHDDVYAWCRVDIMTHFWPPNVNKWTKTKSKPKPTLIFKNFSCVCISLCTTVVHNTAQNTSDNFPSYPPDRGWWRWALVSPDGVGPSRMVIVSASVNLPLHHKVQKFSSGTGSPGWSRKKGRKTVVVVVNLQTVIMMTSGGKRAHTWDGSVSIYETERMRDSVKSYRGRGGVLD